jgi:hypothetical protein
LITIEIEKNLKIRFVFLSKLTLVSNYVCSDQVGATSNNVDDTPYLQNRTLDRLMRKRFSFGAIVDLKQK